MPKKAWIESWKKKQTNPKYPVRAYHRCGRCGRARGFLRRFGLCRICFRELASQGLVPGIAKSSW